MADPQVYFDPATGREATWDAGKKDWVISPPKTAAPVNTAAPTPKGSTAAVSPPEDYSPTWGEAGEDVKRSIVPGLEKGALAFPTAPATIGGLAAKGVGAIADALPESKLTEKISSGAQKAQDWLKPWDFQTNQNKFEESYNRFKPPDKQFYHPKYTSGQVAEQLASFAPGMFAGGGAGLIPRAMTTGASALGAQAGGGLAGMFGEEYAPYGELIGALRGGKAANLPRRMVTPNPMSAAERAAGDLVRSKAGPNSISAGQYTQNPKLLQREGNMLDYAPDTFKSMIAGQPEAMSHALLKETGATPPASGPTVARAMLANAKKDIGDRTDTMKALNVDASGIAHPTITSKFDPEFYAKQQSIQKELYGTKKPDLAKPNALDTKLQEIFNDTGNITHDSTTAIRGGLNGESYYNLRTDIGGEMGKLYKAGKTREAEALGKLRTALDENMERSLKGTPHEGKLRELQDQQEALRAIKESIKNSPDPTAPVEASKVFGATKGVDSPIAKLSSAITQTAKPLPEAKVGIDIGPVLGAAVGGGLGHFTGAGGLEAGVLGTLHGPLVNSLLKGPRATMAKILLSPTGQKWLSNTTLGPGTHMDPKTARRLLAVQGVQTPYKLDQADEQGK